MSLHVVLVQPEIPPNTGNIARLCAAAGVPLHLVDPLGFKLDDRHLKRAGLDYWPYVRLIRHASLEDFLAGRGDSELYFFSTRARRSYLDVRYQKNQCLVFGSETRGLPGQLFEQYSDRFLRIPILQPGVRSLNLSSAVAVVVYEALRQLGKL